MPTTRLYKSIDMKVWTSAAADNVDMHLSPECKPTLSVFLMCSVTRAGT